MMVSHNTSALSSVCLNLQNVQSFEYVKLGYFFIITDKSHEGKEGSYRDSQGLQILLMSGVTVTSASQILESFWKIWSQVSQRKKPFSDFTARGPGMNNYRDGYTV